mgnify:CR=1 FL=1
MFTGQFMYLHTNSMEELFNNFLYMVKDRLTPEEQYMITKEYHKIKYRELENKQLQEKELKEQTKTIEDTIIKELNKSFK